MADELTPSSRAAVSLADVEAAARRLSGTAVRTPLLQNPALDAEVGGRVLVKPEVLQRTGSFKFRGAFNRIALIPEAERSRGVVAWSSGNHAQGVAAAAGLFGIPAVIVMPSDAPAIKIANTRALGAEVVLYDRAGEDREGIGRGLAADRGATVVPPFDDPGVIAGQGTIGLEIAADAAALGLSLDEVLMPCSGGGLAAGIATAVAARSPGTRVWTVEPAGFDDMKRSLETGERVRNSALGGSLCDALLAATPGAITFPIGKALLAGGLAVTDEEALEAVGFAARHLKLVVEPGGAVALAALLTGKLPVRGRTVAVVLSGGNIDPEILQRALS